MMQELEKLEKIEWAIIYDGLGVFTNLDGSWEEAPAWGAQAIVYKSIETGWSICTTGDHFIQLSNGEFLPIGDNALQDYAANVWKKIKVGRMLSREEFAKVNGLALSLMGELKKTAYFRNERQE